MIHFSGVFSRSVHSGTRLKRRHSVPQTISAGTTPELISELTQKQPDRRQV
jgi:hypothetical protein